MSLVTRAVRALALVLLLTAFGAPVVHGQSSSPQPPATTAAQDEYVPIDQLPENEKLPAAPFLVAAYTFAWLAIVVYVLMLWRRLGRVEQELREARRTITSG